MINQITLSFGEINFPTHPVLDACGDHLVRVRVKAGNKSVLPSPTDTCRREISRVMIG